MNHEKENYLLDFGGSAKAYLCKKNFFESLHFSFLEGKNSIRNAKEFTKEKKGHC